ncbi:hypothetical protein AGR7A_Cc250098 [Agrobacterium deltaense NCPPB 1641]|uniref:Uncharacterized protein n=1 Tax=Agrobacterium deltaense NCPPB 1641 TaxID=1183425 RepID=A0A1S7TN38_9HYPH|nr:hypothetical protein AGR7A_Cc250098 [Agrobacterium deltaense NCPPB 1641]
MGGSVSFRIRSWMRIVAVKQGMDRFGGLLLSPPGVPAKEARRSAKRQASMSRPVSGDARQESS